MPVLGRHDEGAVGRADSISRLIRGMIVAAPATLRLPAGSAKSFWTSTTINAEPGPYRCMRPSVAQPGRASSYPMSADRSSGTTGATVSGGTGGSTSSR